MAIETTLGALVVAQEPLTRLADVKVSARHGYHLAKLVTLVTAEVAHFETRRAVLLREVGVERPATPAEATTLGPTVVQVPPEQMAAFTQAIADLAAVPVSLAWEPFDLGALTGDAMFSAADLVRLGPLVTYEQEG